MKTPVSRIYYWFLFHIMIRRMYRGALITSVEMFLWQILETFDHHPLTTISTVETILLEMFSRYYTDGDVQVQIFSHTPWCVDRIERSYGIKFGNVIRNIKLHLQKISISEIRIKIPPYILMLKFILTIVI